MRRQDLVLSIGCKEVEGSDVEAELAGFCEFSWRFFNEETNLLNILNNLYDATKAGAQTDEILSGHIASQLHDFLRNIVDPGGGKIGKNENENDKLRKGRERSPNNL